MKSRQAAIRSSARARASVSPRMVSNVYLVVLINAPVVVSSLVCSQWNTGVFPQRTVEMIVLASVAKVSTDSERFGLIDELLDGHFLYVLIRVIQPFWSILKPIFDVMAVEKKCEYVVQCFIKIANRTIFSGVDGHQPA